MNINLVEMVYDLVMYQEMPSQYQEPSIKHLQTGVLVWQVQNNGTVYLTIRTIDNLYYFKTKLRPTCLMRHLTNCVFIII